MEANQQQHQDIIDELGRSREKFIRGLGRLSDKILGRNVDMYEEPEKYFWPSSPGGKIRIVKRTDGVMFVTDGFSDPWDLSLHASVPPGTFDCELAIEIANSEFSTFDDQELSRHWGQDVLWIASETIVSERFDVVGCLQKFNCVTVPIASLIGLGKFVGRNGSMLGLVGIPPGGERGMSVVMAHHAEQPIYLLTLKLLTSDETDFALANNSKNAYDLIERFIKRGDRHLNWTDRPSVLTVPFF